MKKFFLLLGLVSAMYCSAQNSSDSIILKSEQLLQKVESSKVQSDAYMDHMLKEMHDENLNNTLKQNEENLNNYMAEMQAKKKQDNKRLYIRAAVLLVFIAVGIFSYVRKRRKVGKV